eukprot:TRINITY_DN11939_c0_g1_i1.p1 TRINITY_DN11939_c0_g1~~TRINITY_DN11939_c0_g1_i1.p1  ORF type:complete len:215 (-),score=51.79 TRINITY_DN11939_c0_g1_i1:187-831(-)
MGKNQAYKAMQRAKMASHTAAGGVDDVDDGMMDGSFHSPEWHAARLASLQTSHTVTWEEWKQKQKEEAKKQGELEDDEARLMKEYRAQLDAERASKLARGKNHNGKRASPRKGLGKKDREREREKQREKSRLGKKKKKSSKRHRSKSESESDEESSSSEDDRDMARKERRKAKRDRKDKKQKTRRKDSSSESQSEDEPHGPLPLSSYFENGKAK